MENPRLGQAAGFPRRYVRGGRAVSPESYSASPCARLQYRSSLVPPMTNRKAKRVSFHPDGRFSTLQQLRKLCDRRLGARVLP